MEIIKSIILGLVQGVSEFLPVSSSGHLIIFAEILNFQEEGIAFEVFVHFGTLLSIFVAFRKELTQMITAPFLVYFKKDQNPTTKEYLRWDYYVIVSSVPAAIVGIFFKDFYEYLFSKILPVFFMLSITGFIMIISPKIKDRGANFNYKNTFIIGIAQAFAILPGISRSGSTIFTGMALGIEREKVAKFSFIMSIPAIIGAVILKLNDVFNSQISNSDIVNYTVGTIVAFISGYLAIIWLLGIVKKGKLQWFGYYCFFVSGIGLIWYFTR